MKRILSLDGGGIHGVFTLQVLRRIEQLIAAQPPEKRLLPLGRYFDLIAGTSTGAIIASMLAWGATVDEIERFYLAQAPAIFRPSPWWRRWTYNRFTTDGITRFLQNYFTDGGKPAELGSKRLKTFLLVMLRNATTGSPWPVTNNPRSIYNDRPEGQSNLEIPLWKIVRASTAAPTFFPPQKIGVWSTTQNRRVDFEFIDGGISPCNNPAYVAYLMATLPEYRMEFAPGAGNLLLISVGVGRREIHYRDGEVQDMNVVGHVRATIAAMLDAANVQQDILCRTTGLCLHGAIIDRELQTLILDGNVRATVKAERPFSYVRYNHTYGEEEAEKILTSAGGKWDLANLKLIPAAMAAGKAYAEKHVDAAHLW